VAQVVECLPSKHEALSSKCHDPPTKKKRQWKRVTQDAHGFAE
jgi:hypothetical protein